MYKAKATSPMVIKTKDATSKHTNRRNQPGNSSRHHPQHKILTLFVDLELEEKKRRAVKAKESATQRKRRKNDNDKKQMLLTNFLASDPVARAKEIIP